MDAVMENAVLIEDVLDELNLPPAIAETPAANDSPEPELFEEGPTFQCGKDGSITGYVFDYGERGCLYQLDDDVTVYKRVRRTNRDTGYVDSVVIPLTIPAWTMIRAPWKRNSYAHQTFAIYNQCVAAEACVGQLPTGYKYVGIGDGLVYKSGETVKTDVEFNLDPDDLTGEGIKFFYEERFAENWVL